MRTFAFAALALVCNVAFADGSPLFSKGPGLDTAEVSSIKAERTFATTVESVAINRDAIYSTVITASVGGKDFRFVGGPSSGLSEGVRGWNGMDQAATLSFIVNGKTVLGQIKFANRAFEFQSLRAKDVLMELVDDRDFTPAGVAAAREALERKKAKP